jgi:hypothetical protein
MVTSMNLLFIGPSPAKSIRAADKLYGHEHEFYFKSTRDNFRDDYIRTCRWKPEHPNLNTLYSITTYRGRCKFDLLFCNVIGKSGQNLDRNRQAKKRSRFYDTFLSILDCHEVESFVLELPYYGDKAERARILGQVLVDLSRWGYDVWWMAIKPSDLDESRGLKRIVIFGSIRGFRGKSGVLTLPRKMSIQCVCADLKAKPIATKQRRGLGIRQQVNLVRDTIKLYSHGSKRTKKSLTRPDSKLSGK